MSDSGRTNRPGSPAPTPNVESAEAKTGIRSLKPGELGPARMNPVNEERASANAQIQRTMKAWRAANGSPGRASVPKGTGAPLATAVRSRMEPKLGANLGSVRVHTGADSAEAAKGFGARAFTVGEDVHFNAGEFQPGTKEGDKLLAHELTHVVQGQKSGVQRKADDGEDKSEQKAGGDEKAGEEVSDPDEPAEKEADATAEKVGDELHADEQKDGDKKDGDDKKAAKGKDKKDDKADGKKDDKADGKKDDKAEAKDDKAEAKDDKAEAKDDKAGDKAEPAAAPAPVSRQIRRKIFRTGTNPPPAPAGGGGNPDEQRLVNEWNGVKGNDVHDGPLGRVLGEFADRIDAMCAANPQNAALLTVKQEMTAKVQAAYQASEADLQAVDQELDAATDRKTKAEELVADRRWFSWSTHGLLGLLRPRQQPRLQRLHNKLDRARSNTPFENETEVPGCTYDGRAVVVYNGMAYYQSSGQSTPAAPGQLAKPQGSWMRIYGVQMVVSQLNPRDWKPDWLMKQSLASPAQMAEIFAPPMPNVVFKAEGNMSGGAALNSWLAGKGIQVVTNIDDTVPPGQMPAFRAHFARTAGTPNA